LNLVCFVGLVKIGGLDSLLVLGVERGVGFKIRWFLFNHVLSSVLLVGVVQRFLLVPRAGSTA